MKRLKFFFFLFMIVPCGFSKAFGQPKILYQLGPRPYYLIDQLPSSKLKNELKACTTKSIQKSYFSIAHRGAPLMFPEHSRESYLAAIRMGAGVIECDVTFTKDKKLVCRHSQCDLHQTTDILQRPELAKSCRKAFMPFDASQGRAASAECCTSDISLAEFKTLCAKMDGLNPEAKNVQEYLAGTPAWRTDLYNNCADTMSHRDSIVLAKKYDVSVSPELKQPLVAMPFREKFTREKYRRLIVQEYKDEQFPVERVWLQSFELDDIKFWLKAYPNFARQAVYLDGRYTARGFDYKKPETLKPTMKELKDIGINFIGSPLWMLLATDKGNNLVPSAYSKEARAAKLSLIAWTLERSGPISNTNDWYYSSINRAIKSEGDLFQVIDVLAKDVGVKKIFSDWPATVTYYANCFNL